MGDAFKLAFGLSLAILIPDDARHFLKKTAPVRRLAGEKLVNLTLTDNGVSLLAYARVREEVNNVPKQTGTPIKKVLTGPVPVHSPGYGNLGVVNRERPVTIINGQPDFSIVERAPAVTASKDKILHNLAPQLFRALLTQNPSDGIGNIALPATVGPNDGGNAGLEYQTSLVSKGFKAVQI